MRRVITALIATAAGVAALLSFRSHATPGLGTTTTGALAAAPTPQATPSTANPGAPAPSQNAPSSGGAAPASHAKNGTFTGTAENTPYGPVQVSATVAGGRLTDVTVLQVPDNGRYEDQIVSIALPMLHSEALSKQSANIDIVSGATFTSQGYSQSLQSALDQAGL